MPAIRFSVVCLIFALLLASACGKPDCNNTNPVFDQYGTDEETYQQELIRQLKSANQGEMTFWIAGYAERNGRPHLLVDMVGEGICAQGWVRIDDPSGIEHVVRNQARGYRGAELVGLQLEVSDDALVYRSVQRVVD